MKPGTFPIDRLMIVAIMPNKKTHAHCEMGGRAKMAAELLTIMGHQNAIVLEETFDELTAAGIFDVVGGVVESLTDYS